MANGFDQPISLTLLRRAFTSEHYAQLFKGEETHDAARDLIAQLVAHTQDEDLLHAIVASGLPSHYQGNTLREIPSMVRGALRKGFDKRDHKAESRSDKKRPNLLDVALGAGIELFHDRDKRGFISVPQANGGAFHYPILGDGAKHWLRSLIYSKTGKPIPRQALEDIILTLEAQAIYVSPLHDIAVRIGQTGDAIYFDLGRPDAVVVRITSGGWVLTPDCPIKFVRPAGFGELPEPTRNGKVQFIRELLQLDDTAWTLVLAFLINCLRPGGPYFCLLVEGEQGSGKSVLCTIIKKIIDPSSVEKMRLPDSEQNLMIQAKDYYLLVFDNVSGMKADISDALCVLSTGGGMTFRKLYTDADRQVFNQVRPFIINGIGEFVHRPDLIERALLLSLPSMPEGARKTEAQIWAEFDAALPGILGSLFDIVAVALKSGGSLVAPTTIRMADAAAWLAAAEPGTGLDNRAFLLAIEESQMRSVIDRISENPTVILIERMIEMAPFHGRVSELHEQLNHGEWMLARALPKTPQHLSKALARLKPAMAKIGILVELESRNREGRTVLIWKEGQDPARPAKLNKYPPY
jgi:hypothetical protein